MKVKSGSSGVFPVPTPGDNTTKREQKTIISARYGEERNTLPIFRGEKSRNTMFLYDAGEPDLLFYTINHVNLEESCPISR